MPAGRPKRPVDDVRVQLKYEQNMKGRARAERDWFKGLTLWIVEQLEEGELRNEIIRKVEEHEGQAKAIDAGGAGNNNGAAPEVPGAAAAS